VTTSIQQSTPSGIILIEARTLLNGNYTMEIATSPARWTGLSPSEKLTVGSGAVVHLSPASNSTHAILVNESNAIRWYDTGDTPTTGASGNGPQLAAGDYLELDLANFALFGMIAVSASSTVHVLYRRSGN
jgi:hypothetical protein